MYFFLMNNYGLAMKVFMQNSLDIHHPHPEMEKKLIYHHLLHSYLRYIGLHLLLVLCVNNTYQSKDKEMKTKKLEIFKDTNNFELKSPKSAKEKRKLTFKPFCHA